MIQQIVGLMLPEMINIGDNDQQKRKKIRKLDESSARFVGVGGLPPLWV